MFFFSNLIYKYYHFKVIPQYGTAHPVLRIIGRNWEQYVMAAFLPGKLEREKNGRFGKAWHFFETVLGGGHSGKF